MSAVPVGLAARGRSESWLDMIDLALERRRASLGDLGLYEVMKSANSVLAGMDGHGSS